MSGKFVVRLIKIGLAALAILASIISFWIMVYVALVLLQGDSVETAIASVVSIETVIAIAIAVLFLSFVWAWYEAASRADDRMGRE